MRSNDDTPRPQRWSNEECETYFHRSWLLGHKMPTYDLEAAAPGSLGINGLLNLSINIKYIIFHLDIVLVKTLLYLDTSFVTVIVI